MKTIAIPEKEYLEMKEKIKLLEDSKFLQNVNRLINMLYQEKYGLILTDFTEDLVEYSLNNLPEWKDEKSARDDV